MKKTILTLLLPGLILAYQPASPPPVALTAPPLQDPHASRVIAVVPAVIIGGVIVGGVAWAGLKIANKIMDIWAQRLTNGAPAEIQFTWAEDEYPE